MDRREFLRISAAGAVGAGLSFPNVVEALSPSPIRPIVGAIRWDAFYGTGKVAKAVERSLGPARYHARAPFFAKVTGPDSLSINGDAPDVMAQEIDYAARAGVYWAFLNYNWDDDMTRPLRMFVKHPDRHRVNFTLILNRCVFDNAEWDNHFRDFLRQAATMPNFQTVMGGRPLIFTFLEGRKGKANWKGQVRRRLDEVRSMLQKATGKNPYIVHFMHMIPPEEWPQYKAMGFDDTTLYAHFGRKRETYVRFRKRAEKSWRSWVDANIPHVPLLSAGWDNRPRYYNPVPWVKPMKHMLDSYAQAPTADELAAHFKAGMDFVYQHQRACPAQSLMMYAWNEHDEGGWLCPTLDPATGKADDSRVRAVGRVIHNWKPARMVG